MGGRDYLSVVGTGHEKERSVNKLTRVLRCSRPYLTMQILCFLEDKFVVQVDVGIANNLLFTEQRKNYIASP